MIAGWSGPLQVFALDHRNSFRKLIGLDASSTVDRDRGKRLKRVAFDGFSAALASLPDREGAALLIDEEYGADLVQPAREAGALVCLPLERSGQDELGLEYGDDTARVVETVAPDLVKVLLRFNPEGDRELNVRQAARLAALSDWCLGQELPLVLEVLMPPTPAQLRAAGDRDTWDRLHRPPLMVRAVDQLRAAGADPCLWKVEGLDDPADARAVVAAVRRDDRTGVCCLVLGRGADLERVEHWLSVGARTDGYVGFAVGRSLWNASVAALSRGELSEAAARERISEHYRRLCTAWWRDHVPA